MKFSELASLNFSWPGRDWLIIQLHADADEPPKPLLCEPIEAAMAYGDEIVLGFDGDMVYLK